MKASAVVLVASNIVENFENAADGGTVSAELAKLHFHSHHAIEVPDALTADLQSKSQSGLAQRRRQGNNDCEETTVEAVRCRPDARGRDQEEDIDDRDATGGCRLG